MILPLVRTGRLVDSGQARFAPSWARTRRSRAAKVAFATTAMSRGCHLGRSTMLLANPIFGRMSGMGGIQVVQCLEGVIHGICAAGRPCLECLIADVHRLEGGIQDTDTTRRDQHQNLANSIA
jgi:hypothetical protein